MKLLAEEEYQSKDKESCIQAIEDIQRSHWLRNETVHGSTKENNAIQVI